MGEYATRKADNVKIKIGTCEDMLYLRYEDRNAVRKLPDNVDAATDTGIRFRLPFPDEDHIKPGDYDDPFRGLRLYWQDGNHEDFTDESTSKDAGNIQLRHECGLLINVPCYHGHKMPDFGAGIKAFWNGKSWSLELRSLRAMPDGSVLPVVECRHCGHLWRYSWGEIWDFVPYEMRVRLRDHMEHAVKIALATVETANKC